MTSKPPEEGVPSDARAVVQAAVDAVARAGSVASANIAGAVEAACAAMCRRAVDRALSAPRKVADAAALADALGEPTRAPLVGNATAAAIITRWAAKFGPFSFLAKRTPMWLVAAAVPALGTSVNRGAYELETVASHLVVRSRTAGVEPDPAKVRRVAAQLLAGVSINPWLEPSYGRLGARWLRRGLRAAMPFGGNVVTRDTGGLARRAAEVEVADLAHPTAGQDIAAYEP